MIANVCNVLELDKRGARPELVSIRLKTLATYIVPMTIDRRHIQYMLRSGGGSQLKHIINSDNINGIPHSIILVGLLIIVSLHTLSHQFTVEITVSSR